MYNFWICFGFGILWVSSCKPEQVGFALVPESFSDMERFSVFSVLLINGHEILSYFDDLMHARLFYILSFGEFLYALEQVAKDVGNIYKIGLLYRKDQVLGYLCNEIQ